MRKLQVLPAAVNVEMRSQQFRAHRRALDMPARTPVAPRRLPEGLALLGALPQDKIEWSRLLGSTSTRSPARRSSTAFPESFPYPEHFRTEKFTSPVSPR